jgi:hypothetical protein
MQEQEARAALREAERILQLAHGKNTALLRELGEFKLAISPATGRGKGKAAP